MPKPTVFILNDDHQASSIRAMLEENGIEATTIDRPKLIGLFGGAALGFQQTMPEQFFDRGTRKNSHIVQSLYFERVGRKSDRKRNRKTRWQ